MGKKQIAKDRRKKGSKTRSKELNARGEKMEGSDMDAFTDVKESKENTSPVSEESATVLEPAATEATITEGAITEGATAASPKETTPEPSVSPPQLSKETTPVPETPSPEEPTPPTPQPEVTTESKPNEEELKRVAERNEKNSKEHSRSEEPGTVESSSNSTLSPDSTENHVKSNDQIVDKSEPVIKKDKIELKYKYREDQWSPLNPEGKKFYDRGFLLQLQYSSESLEKPFGLPQLPDVVLETPVMGRNERQFVPAQTPNSKGMLDFTPSYVVPNLGGKPPVHQGRRSARGGRASGSGGGGGGHGGHKVINITLGQHDVKLHQTENAWKPDHASKNTKKDEEASSGSELEDMLKKVRSILNKLTPQKFQKLVQQVLDLGIDTEDKLAGTIDVTFEKAISEPNFSVAYANLCKRINDLKVPTSNNPNEFVMFRKLLLNRCQKEFERDKADLLDLEEMQKAIDEAPAKDKKKLTALKDMAELAARRRSLGNIRFIGELFKLRMLTEPIMHDCLLKLLRAKDEDSLEALCRLLTTIGKDIDHERAKDKIEQYLKQLQIIIDSKKTTSRVRFMMQDVIDLRKSHWVPRRDDNAPKTIEQIHKDALEEEQKKKILLATVTIDTKRKGGRGSQSGQSRGQQGEDGWTPVKPSRAQAIDPSKMKITKQSMDENMQLGPGGRPGSFGTWGKGSSGGSKAASKEGENRSAPGNRYTLLSGGGSGGGGSDGYDSGRSSGYGHGGMSQGRDSKGGRISQGRDRDRDRGKSGPRLSQEQERESALAAARNIGVPRSTSGSRTPVGSRNQSRESSRNRDPPSRDRSSDKRPSSASPKELSLDEIEKKSKSLLDEYLSIHDLKEAILCIKELESPKSIHMCINFILTHVLERSSKARQMASHLLHEGIKQKVITPDQYTRGLLEVLEFAEDMAIDIPQIWKYLGELIGPMVEDGMWTMSTLKTACQPLLQFNKAGLLVAHVLEDISHRLGHLKVGDLWRHNHMHWADYVPANDNLQEFIAKHKLEYTLGPEAPKSPEATTLPIDRIQRELEKLIEQRDNEVVFDWVDANVADSRTRESAFIRALMTTVCSNSITGEGSSCKVDAERLKKRCILLQRFLDHDAKLELQALYALQALVHRLEHPTEVLRVFFDTLYDEDIISEDAFYQWEASKDPAETAGKGVAVTSVVQFFTWLREAEEEEPTNN